MFEQSMATHTEVLKQSRQVDGLHAHLALKGDGGCYCDWFIVCIAGNTLSSIKSRLRTAPLSQATVSSTIFPPLKRQK